MFAEMLCLYTLPYQSQGLLPGGTEKAIKHQVKNPSCHTKKKPRRKHSEKEQGLLFPAESQPIYPDGLFH